MPISTNLTKAPEQSLSDQAYDILERMIISLELEPGSLVSEAELAERVGIGRTPLREALQRLAADRLVIALPRRGMMITKINASEYLNLLDTRDVLDALIAKQAARRARPEERERLRACARGMAEVAALADQEAFMQLDRTCDTILEQASRNTYAYHAVRPLHAHSRRFWSAHRHLSDLTLSAELHARIMIDVADGKENEAGKASRALIAYLEAFARRALDL